MKATSSGALAIRASLLDYADDPFESPSSVRYVADGLLVVEQGRIVACGEHAELKGRFSTLDVADYTGKLLMPGFIDAHVHYPQTTMIGAYGDQLLTWLQSYAFPTEQRFADEQHAELIADRFLAELLRNGTTSAVVLCTVHPASVSAFGRRAEALGLRMIFGKVAMDRNAPPGLTDSAETTYADNQALIERWQGRGRLAYALTPRFAPSCSGEQLSALAQLHRDYPSTYLHTHLSENLEEIQWVASLFPERASYTDVYDHYGLVTPRSIFAHGIHLQDGELRCLAEQGATIAFCPTSNLFLGSGLFPLRRVKGAGVGVAMGTDVGAGTSFSLLRTLGEAYKVLQLQGHRLPVHEALYLATRGAACTLELSDAIGSLEPGKEADFAVLDFESTPLLALRSAYAQSLEDKLFALMTLGDDRAIFATYVAGRLAHERDAPGPSPDGHSIG